MLKIVVPGAEHYDEANEEFLTIGDVELELEHSLVSLSKWESIFEKPFLNTKDKTTEEVLAYIECMIITPDFPPGIISRLSQENLDTIHRHIEAKMTATWITEPTKGAARAVEIITSELIYYWLVSFNIPFHPAETWHLNRLFMLIRVCSEKNGKPKKMSRTEMAARNRELNAQRKAALNTKG